MNGIGSHQSARMKSDEWLTPPWIIERLGPFDLDPCYMQDPPFKTASRIFTREEDGLAHEWEGRVWLNPPYGKEAAEWLRRLAQHNKGTALIFARTETDMFFRYVWEKAEALLFIRGRLHFYYPDGRRSKTNTGGPSVLIAYGLQDAVKLQRSDIDGKFIWMVP